MIIGVSTGFEKALEINGVGYRAQKQGKKLVQKKVEQIFYLVISLKYIQNMSLKILQLW